MFTDVTERQIAHEELRTHREELERLRMDGSGYPQGLLKEDIHLWAGILSVADVVEGVSSRRPYRPAVGV
jgi:HD-GYP domain-containing protein (c-di-GMP phosphodiesterase class II)